MSEAADIQ